MTAIDFSDPKILADPYPLYSRLQREDPIHWDAAQQGWLVTRYDDVVAGLRDPALSARADRSYLDVLPDTVRREAGVMRRHFESWMLFTDPPEHTRLRTLVQRSYAGHAVAHVRGSVERAADRLLLAAEADGRIEALHGYAVPLAIVALSAFFAVGEDELAGTDRWSDDILYFMNVEPTVEVTRRGARAVDELGEFVRRACGRRDLPAGSPVRALSDSLAGGHLDEPEAVATMAQSVTGGLGAIPQLVVNGLLTLLGAEGQLARLRGDPALRRTALEELLRLESPFLLVARTASRDTKLRGVDIRAGEPVGFMLGAANRDPEQFTCPERLDIARADNRHLAFGMGVHYCLGAALARLVAEIALSSIVGRFSAVEVATPTLDRMPLFGMRWLRSLPLHLAR